MLPYHSDFFFICCNSVGAITFLSKAFGGRILDIEIIRQSGFVSINYYLPGDQILADRGFTMQEDFATVCSAELIIPAFSHGKFQLLAQEVETSRRMSSVRIHIERIIGLIKNWLKKIKDESKEAQLARADKIVHVCAALTNFGGSIVPERESVMTEHIQKLCS